MNFKLLGVLICVLGAVGAFGSMRSKQMASSDLAAKRVASFYEASGSQAPEGMPVPVESVDALEKRKERAEWLSIAGLVLCGLGVAVGVAAKKPVP